jgi:hypothetical protein
MRHVLLASVILVGCSSSEAAPGSQPRPHELFGEAISTIVLEVDYAEGADPYTGSMAATEDLWNLFGANAAALFPDKTLVFPRELEAMEAVGPVAGESFDTGAILGLAAMHRDQLSAGDVATFYALWLDGNYEEDGEPQPEVLGVSIGDTGVIAMFKPVIEGSGIGPLDAVSRYVEQATLVHEVGHAVGLVNRGLPLTSEHHDADHGAHCSEEDCVMYFAIEGVGGAVDFVTTYVTTGDDVLFGDECLADAEAAR